MDKNKTQILKKTLIHLNARMTILHLSLYRICNNIDDGEAVVVLMNDTFKFTAYIQSWAPQQDFLSLLKRLNGVSGNVLLLADFVNPVMAEKLRQQCINFVDCAGNMCLQTKALDVFVNNNKDMRQMHRHNKGRVFNPAGLKLLYAFFNAPELLNASYRSISNEVGVASGSIGSVLENLQLSGYVAEKDNRKWLVNKKRLFERWVDAYLEKLRPKQMLGRYHATEIDWWKNIDIKRYRAQWGGEVVIARQTPFMQPENITIYSSNDNIEAFLQDSQLQLDMEGEVALYQAFWLHDIDKENVNPMIIYADLVDSVDPGNWDVAKTFYGEAIADLLTDSLTD